MMQADPYIQAPDHLQSFNRYSYVMNNPLMYTDPSGKFFWVVAAWFVGAIITARTFEFITPAQTRQLFGIVVGVVLAPISGGASLTPGFFLQAAVAGFASGAIASDSFKGGVRGAFSALIFAGVGANVGSGVNAAGKIVDVAQFAIQVGAHAVAGCVIGVATGGKCGPSALSAAFSKLATPLTGQMNAVVGTFASAIIGGTAAKLGGGKFANGAMTGAFSYVFNERLTKKDGSPIRAYRYSYTGSPSDAGDDLNTSMTSKNRGWSKEEGDAVLPAIKLGIIFVPGGGVLGAVFDGLEIMNAFVVEKDNNKGAANVISVGTGEAARHAASMTHPPGPAGKFGGVVNWLVDRIFSAERDYLKPPEESSKK
jgi:hypothetical protein